MAKLHPTYEMTCEHLERAAASSAFIRAEVVGKSFEGRDLWLATVTDSDVADDDKQTVVLTCGVHGSEESGRALGLAVLDWVQTAEAEETLRKQKILVFTCVNPDGAGRDSYHNAQDINLCRAYSRDGNCTAPEAQAVWDVLIREMPDAFVDCHGLAGGGMHELVLPTLGRRCASENIIHHAIAMDMTRAAERAGFPQQIPHSVDCWVGPEDDWIEKMLFDRFATIGFTLEMNEGYLTTEQTQASGLARLVALFDYGNRASFGLPFEGYPNGWLLGGSMHGLIPHGRNPGERRRSRAAACPFLPQFYHLNRRPDRDGVCTVTLRILDGDVPAPPAVTTATRVYPWCSIEEVSFDGEALERNGWPTGWRVHHDGVSEMCLVDLGFEVTVGDHQIQIRYQEQRQERVS